MAMLQPGEAVPQEVQGDPQPTAAQQVFSTAATASPRLRRIGMLLLPVQQWLWDLQQEPSMYQTRQPPPYSSNSSSNWRGGGQAYLLPPSAEGWARLLRSPRRWTSPLLLLGAQLGLMPFSNSRRALLVAI